jgi:hypothetical protein
LDLQREIEDLAYDLEYKRDKLSPAEIRSKGKQLEGKKQKQALYNDIIDFCKSNDIIGGTFSGGYLRCGLTGQPRNWNGAGCAPSP